LDEAFGDRGIVVTQDGDTVPEVSHPPSDFAAAVALQPDGRIVVAEQAGDILVARYLGVSVLPAGAVGSPTIGRGGRQTACPRPSSSECPKSSLGCSWRQRDNRRPRWKPHGHSTDAPADNKRTTFAATDTATLEPTTTA
jgi:hypothetical protein